MLNENVIKITSAASNAPWIPFPTFSLSECLLYSVSWGFRLHALLVTQPTQQGPVYYLHMPTCGAMWLFINLIVITNYYACPIGRTTSACCPIVSSSKIRQHVSTILSMEQMDQSTFSERRMNNQNNSFLISKYMYGIDRITYLFPNLAKPLS